MKETFNADIYNEIFLTIVIHETMEFITSFIYVTKTVHTIDVCLSRLSALMSISEAFGKEAFIYLPSI